jgi:HEAT repeat protein
MSTHMLILLAGSLLILPAAGRAQEGSNDDLKKDALFLLASRHTPESRQFLRTFYQRTTDSELRKTVIFHIAQSGSEEDLRWLRERVEDEQADEESRSTALFWLAQNRNLSMTELEELYGRVQSRELKEKIIFAYSQRSEPEATDRLMKVARQDPDQKLRKTALFWLAQSGDERVTQFLVDIVNE